MARKRQKADSGASLGFEEKLWLAADKLRGHMDAAEYKHVVLGLVFLKSISDAFEEHRRKLLATPGADPEDRDEYAADRVFWVPKEACWAGEGGLQAGAKQPAIGRLVDDAMVAIERENPSLKGVLPKDDARPTLDGNSKAGPGTRCPNTCRFRTPGEYHFWLCNGGELVLWRHRTSNLVVWNAWNSAKCG
jgi:type I restriction enzyme M protein